MKSAVYLANYDSSLDQQKICLVIKKSVGNVLCGIPRIRYTVFYSPRAEAGTVMFSSLSSFSVS